MERHLKMRLKTIMDLLKDPLIKKYFAGLQLEWSFNLEKAPWWGGLFERLIKSAKRCIKKTLGRALLTYDELLTLVIETEAVLNSRPLTYISSDDLEEPLTPSHLLVGYRILSLPDPSPPVDPDFQESPASLTRRLEHVIKVSERFWKRWKREYLTELREFHRNQRSSRALLYCQGRGSSCCI